LIISLRLNAGLRGLLGRVRGSEIFRRGPPSSRAPTGSAADHDVAGKNHAFCRRPTK
jgi:hypothetical protein